MVELWIAVDKSGSVYLYGGKPEKALDVYLYGGDYMEITKEIMIKLIGKEITWEDEPVQIK